MKFYPTFSVRSPQDGDHSDKGATGKHSVKAVVCIVNVNKL